MSYSFTQSQEIQRAAAAIENVDRAFNTQSNIGYSKLKPEQLGPLQELCHMAEKEREEKWDRLYVWLTANTTAKFTTGGKKKNKKRRRRTRNDGYYVFSLFVYLEKIIYLVFVWWMEWDGMGWMQAMYDNESKDYNA